MSSFNVICGAVSADKITINKNELAQRLNADRDFEHSVIDFCTEEFKKIADYRYAYAKVPVKFVADNVCNIGFGDIYSKNLYKLLQGCKTAVIVAVTTGIGVAQSRGVILLAIRQAGLSVYQLPSSAPSIRQLGA